MEDNLVFLLNKMSYQIVTQEFENDKNLHSEKKNDRYFKKYVKRLRQKGCDVLLKKSLNPTLEDPCITDYGGNWSPLTIITDYGKELKDRGAGKLAEILLSSIKSLEENNYEYINEMLKFLLLLKKPFSNTTTQFQRDISLNGFFRNSLDTFSVLTDDYLNIGHSRSSSYKKALQYEESSTQHFDSKFQTLAEYSKKNMLTPDKVSLDSLFTAKSSINKSQSQSNSFVFTDFFTAKSYKSEKNLFDLNSIVYLNENFLLDSFVDNPITHKLPSMSFSEKNFSKSGPLFKSTEQMKRKLHYLPEEKEVMSPAYNNSNCNNGLNNKKEASPKTSAIELKRNSNCCHSFSILYEKTINSKSQHESTNSSDSLMLFNDNEQKKSKDFSLINSYTNSKEIVLGLWEQEQTLIKEFRPDLAIDFPLLRMITLMEFVEDVKYLLTGINSRTFQFNSTQKCFNMEYGTCLDDVTPESLYHFSKEFLEVGYCYIKLNSSAISVGKNNYEACTTVSQAFWKSIFDFLELHYLTVLEIPLSINLMALKSCTRDLHEMIINVAEICKVMKENETLPQGGELLTYLLHIAEKLNKQCIRNVVFGILQNCCTVYFMSILQTWMFKGHLEKKNNEFFVDYRKQKIKIKSRSYYNSFFIAKEKIPSFLCGYEENIFNCGKSIHFLKLFNIEDKFCQLLSKANYPNMFLCLSEEQLENLEKEFKEYGNKVIELCGESITIKTVKDAEKKKEKYYLEYVKEYKKIQEHQQELRRLKELEDLKAKKEIQNKLLNEQKSVIEAEKERKIIEEEAKRKKINEEIKRAIEKETKILNEEKNWIKNYYDDLLKTLENQLNIAEMRKETLQKLLSVENSSNLETSQHIMDVLNDNQIKTDSNKLDNEKNNIEKLDVNSNSSPLSSENLIKIVDAISNSESLITVDPSFFQNREESLIYDENSNPSANLSVSEISNATADKSVLNDKEPFTNCTLELESQKNDDNMKTSCSCRTTAQKEAALNKCKILQSEFGFGTFKEPKYEMKMKLLESNNNFRSDLEKNRRKVLESEYEILKNTSDHISIKTTQSKTEIVKENAMNVTLPKLDSQSFQEDLNFENVKLERKMECTNLKNISEQKNLNIGISQSNSSSSFLTPSNDIIFEENALNSTIFDEEVTSNLSEECEMNSALINSKYQNALTRDSEIFHPKNQICYKNIFCNLKNTKVENLPCTDFMKFQRYLQRSALIPLKIQEKLANDALLKHLLIGENLLSHLKSLRGYFFLNDGEFGRSFTCNTFRSLANCTEPQQFFERSNLSNIVHEALNYTIHNCEPNSQNLSFQIVKMPPFLNHSSHDVLSPFELSYKVEWPLNIILTEKALSKYKLVFRFLLKLKRINWTLNENFLYLNSHFKNKKLNEKILVISPNYHKIQIYRHAMTQVMITLDDYIFSNGIQLPWIFFLKDLEMTENIDHLYQKHVRYIKDVLTRCFLSKDSEDLLDYIYNLIELALKFHYTTKSYIFEIVDGKYEHPKFEVLKMTFNEFCLIIKKFLKALKEKISANEVLKSHYILIEKFDLKLA